LALKKETNLASSLSKICSTAERTVNGSEGYPSNQVYIHWTTKASIVSKTIKSSFGIDLMKGKTNVGKNSTSKKIGHQ
jgi:hypothetical protein